MKKVLHERHIDTNATSTKIMMKLSNLDTYVATVGNCINKFHVHVKTLIQSLPARIYMSMDLLENLFKGYKIILNQEFIKYIKTKEDNYEEVEEFSPDKLMHLADTKFETLKVKGVWNSPIR